MSKYIDIIKVTRENKEFSMTIKIEKQYKNEYMIETVVVKRKCIVFDNGILIINCNHAEFFEFKKDEGREKTAKRFHEHMIGYNWFSCISQRKGIKETVKVTINNNSFYLNNRNWRV